jgi:hypothetical protein
MGISQGGRHVATATRRLWNRRHWSRHTHTDVKKVNNTWYYRRSVPLSNTLHPACVLCHTNFTPAFFAETNNTGEWVGALMLRVPIVR